MNASNRLSASEKLTPFASNIVQSLEQNLITLQLDLSDYCVCKCKGCTHWQWDDKKVLDFDVLKNNVLNELPKFKSLQSIVLSGGEPLMYKQVEEVCKMCHQDYGLKVGIITSGLGRKDLDWKTAYKSTGWGDIGTFGIEIRVAATKLPDLEQHNIMNALYKAADLVSGEIRAVIKAESDKTPAEIEKNKRLIEIFPSPIFVEEIPNGYCSDWCCRHLPWFIVTTKIGRIKIGWRKRVIQIDWSDTVVKRTGEELFPDEDTTKGGDYIHAWGLAKAQDYIVKLISEN